jgi:hypothetical protein
LITVDAIDEGGVLKPAQPLPLSEHAQVKVTLESVGDGDPFRAAAAGVGLADVRTNDHHFVQEGFQPAFLYHGAGADGGIERR